MKSNVKVFCLAGLCAAVLFSFAAAVTQAETVAYWRFETAPGFLEDSGPNNMDLTLYDGNADGVFPSQYELPAAGMGAYFPDPIPQTGAAELSAVKLLHNKDGFYGVENAALSFTNGFTIEAFFSRDTVGEARTLFAQGQTSGSTDRGLNIELRKDYTIRFALSADGTAVESIYSSIKYKVDKDYYMAVAVDFANKNVTYYLQNLTDGEEMVQETKSFNAASLHDSSANFFIGAFQGTASFALNDVLDEIRISNVVLPESEFLVNQVPEPSTLALLAAGLVGLMAYAWRKRK